MFSTRGYGVGPGGSGCTSGSGRDSDMGFARSPVAAGSTAVVAEVLASAPPVLAGGDTGMPRVRIRIRAARCDTTARVAPDGHG